MEQTSDRLHHCEFGSYRGEDGWRAQEPFETKPARFMAPPIFCFSKIYATTEQQDSIRCVTCAARNPARAGRSSYCSRVIWKHGLHVFGESLEVQSVGVRDNFFELGGLRCLPSDCFRRSRKSLDSGCPSSVFFRAQPLSILPVFCARG